MRIAIDIDDVIIDLMPTWLDRYYELTGDRIEYENIKTWDMTKVVRDPVLFYSLLKAPNRLYDRCEPVHYAGTAVYKLIKAGYDVVYVTALMDESKLDWLYDVGYIDSTMPLDSRLVITTNKSLVNADMIIDDRAETVIKYPKGGIIFARPWNDVDVLPDKVRRMGSWREIINHLGLGGKHED